MTIIEQIKETRQKEIKEGRNAFTYPPLYIVFEEIITIGEYNSDYDQSTSVFNKSSEYVRVSEDYESEIPAEEQEYKGDGLYNWDKEIEVDDEKYQPVVKKSFHDRFVTLAFTRQGAEDFIKRERHNLKNPKIYVFGVERRNIELMELVRLLGDKI